MIFMQGYAVWQEGMRPRLDRGEVAGVPLVLLRAGRDGWLYCRWIRRLAANLYESGVRTIALSGAFPRQLLEGVPLRAVSPAPLRRAVIEPLLEVFCAQWGVKLSGAAVRLTGPGPDDDVYRIAGLLSRRARYVDVQLDRGSGDLRRMLLHEFGVAGSGGRIPAAEIVFGGEARGDVPALYVGPGCEKQSVAYEAAAAVQKELPAFAADEGLLSLLYAAGGLDAGEIQVKSVGPCLTPPQKLSIMQRDIL